MSENAYEIYERLVKTGMEPKDAAKQAQQTTGIALRSGQPIKSKKVSFSSKGVTYGSEFFGLFRHKR